MKENNSNPKERVHSFWDWCKGSNGSSTLPDTIGLELEARRIDKDLKDWDAQMTRWNEFSKSINEDMERWGKMEEAGYSQEERDREYERINGLIKNATWESFARPNKSYLLPLGFWLFIAAIIRLLAVLLIWGIIIYAIIWLLF